MVAGRKIPRTGSTAALQRGPGQPRRRPGQGPVLRQRSGRLRGHGVPCEQGGPRLRKPAGQLSPGVHATGSPRPGRWPGPGTRSSFFRPPLRGTLTGSGQRGAELIPEGDAAELSSEQGQHPVAHPAALPALPVPQTQLGRRLPLHGFDLVRHTQMVQDLPGEVFVARLGHVQAVRIPHPRIIVRVKAPVVHQHGAVLGGDPADAADCRRRCASSAVRAARTP